MRAIVIDDSRAMRGILKRVLVNAGFEVIEAPDGKEAMAKLAQISCPDLALVDWNMPNMNGLQFVTAVRKDPAYADMKIVMVTTEVETHQMSAALDAGANEYVMKPFTEQGLREKIELLNLGETAAA